MTFTKFQDLFKRSANKFGMTGTIKAAQICGKAREIIRHDYSKLEPHCKVISCKNKVLSIGAKNSKVSQELFYVREKLIKKINKAYDQELVTEIRITIQFDNEYY